MAGFAPGLPVRDLLAALAHYERLGFGREFVHVDLDNNLLRFVTPASGR